MDGQIKSRLANLGVILATAFRGWRMAESRMNQWFALTGSALIFFTMFLIVGDITGRFLFNKPLPGTIEISETALVLVIFGALTYSQIVSGHIRMTLVYSRLSPRLQRICDTLSLAIMLVVLGPWIWKAYSFALASWYGKEVTLGMVSIPVWIPKLFIAIGLSLLLLNCLGNLITRLIPNRVGEAQLKAHLAPYEESASAPHQVMTERQSESETERIYAAEDD